MDYRSSYFWQTCTTDGGVGGAEVEDSLKGSLGVGYGQKKEPTGLKGMRRISVEGRWAGDREKISLRAITDSLHQDGAERDRKSTRLNSSHNVISRMPSSA